MDGGAWWTTVHGVAKSRTRLNDFTFTFPFHALKKEMATHSSVLAWRIPGTAEPGGLLSMGSHRIGHDWSDLAAAAASPYVSQSVQSLICVRLSMTPWTAAHQASLSITNSRACSNSCPLSQWCHPIILSSVVPFSCLQSFPPSGSFPMIHK